MENENKEILERIFEKLELLEKKQDSQSKRIEILERNDSLSSNEDSFVSAPEVPTPQVGGFTPPATPDATSQAKKTLGTVADKLSNVMHLNDYIDKDASKKTSQALNLDDSKKVAKPPQVREAEKNRTKVEEVSFEERVGGRWFAKIGIFVTVLGVSFFLKYAFDNNWISETARVLLGVFAGIVLLGIGEKTIRKYFMYGQLLTGGGLATLYLSIYSAFNFYHLITHITAFGFMGMVTAIGIALSLRYNAPALIIGSTLGGFLTPFLIPTSANIRDILFSYIIMLDLAVLFVSVFKKWRWLNLIGFLGTLLLFSSWLSQHYSETQLVPTFIFLTIFFVIYSLSSLAYNLYRKEVSSGVEQVMTMFTGIIYFISVYGLLDKLYHDLLGLFTILLALYYFALAYYVRHITPKDNNLYNFLAFLSVSFVTIAIPLQFNQFVITLLWTLESAMLSILALRIGREKGGVLQSFSGAIFLLALFRVVFIDYEMYKTNDWFLLNKVFISALVMILVCYVIVYTAKKLKDFVPNSRKVISIFIILASCLTVFAVSRDIIVYHEHVIDKEYRQVKIKNQEIANTYGRGISEYQVTVDNNFIKSRRERSSTALSLFWILYAVIVIAIGMFRHRKELIGFGIGLSVLVIAKSFFADLWALDTLLRPFINFIVVFACYLLAAMFYEYQKISKLSDNFINIKKFIIFFLLAANVLGIMAGSREIEVYYKNQGDTLRKEVSQICSSRYSNKSFTSSVSNNYDSVDCVIAKEKVRKLNSKASVSLSLFWMLYAVLLLIVGFVKSFKWVRIGGIVLLLFSILKLFFVDLWSLGQLYRIIASISLGLVLLVISFAYQKYKDKIREII